MNNSLLDQPELFPALQLQKNVELKKEFALNFGGLEKIEREFKHLLTVKLSSGKTLQQHINKVKDWFDSLHGEKLGNWIKLFAFVKAVDINESAKLHEVKPNHYKFSIKQDKNFYSFFIRPDKNSGQFTIKAKNKILNWLYDNQSTIEFPMIINNQVWNMPIRIYEYAENVSEKEIFFIVNTHILESEFKDYITIDVEEIDYIAELWEAAAEQNSDFKKYWLGNFTDIPLKFLLTLKQIYTSKGNYTTENGFEGNRAWLLKDSLDNHLGNLDDRILKHLQSRKEIRTGKTSSKTKDMKRLLLDTTFKIAVARKWLFSMPEYKEGKYFFNINPGYFAKKETAKRLAIKSP